MSDNEGAKAKSGWTDRELLVYLFALVEHSGVKFDYNSTPRPAGRTVKACSSRIDRLKGTLKNDLEALKNGDSEGTPKKAAGTSRKRKAKDADDGEDTPTKRPRKKKAAVSEEPVIDEPVDDEEMFKVKDELFDHQV